MASADGRYREIRRGRDQRFQIYLSLPDCDPKGTRKRGTGHSFGSYTLSTCTLSIKGLSILSAFTVESAGPREGEGRLLLCVLAAVEAGSFLDKPLMRCGRGIWTIFGRAGERGSKERRWWKNECVGHGPQLSWASWKREAHAGRWRGALES